MGAADVERIEHVRTCPVQFQAYVPGTDVRVHAVGAEVFATAITSARHGLPVCDAQQVDEPAALERARARARRAQRCVALAADLGLEFAGIDLKITPDGEVYCFEVNPSPAYTYFSGQTKQPIPEALARHLWPPTSGPPLSPVSAPRGPRNRQQRASGSGVSGGGGGR